MTLLVLFFLFFRRFTITLKDSDLRLTMLGIEFIYDTDRADIFHRGQILKGKFKNFNTAALSLCMCKVMNFWPLNICFVSSFVYFVSYFSM